MHTYTTFFLLFLVAGMVLLAPSVLRADITAPDPEPYTFENQQKFTLSLETNGSPLATSSIAAASMHDIHYRLWFNEAFLRDYGEITPGHEAGVFQSALEDHRLFLELWSGEPFTSEASVVEHWELPAATSGNISVTFTEPGGYFMVAYLTREIRDEGAYCARYGIPQEFCEEEGYFTRFAPEDTRRYFVGDFGNDGSLHDSNPTAFGGTRLTVTGDFGVSSVLFLPGIKGSRLYEDGTKRWEPFGSGDVQSLFLDESGKSMNARVHARAGNVLSEALGQEFYAAFFNDLEALEASGTLGEGWTWEAGAYDWRLSLTDLTAKGARYEDRIYYNETNGMPYLERLLRDLAAASPTGKVSIVAHSNGGLVAKVLMERLEDAGMLVDKVVLVGVPQSGAPRALAAALFGYGEALPFDECAEWFAARAVCSLIVDRETARAFAEHSPMTYHLLPSEAYFRDVGPIARFDAQEHYQNEIGRYGDTIDSFSELADFSLARDGGRTKPAASDTAHANVLSEALLEYARAIHTTLDVWMPPDGVEVYEIAGWGNDTISGIDFYEEPRYLDLFGDVVPRYRPTFFHTGDGVVPTASAHLSGTRKYWTDLEAAGRSHADMLEMPGMRTLLRDILTGTDAPLPAYIHEAEPSQGERKKLLFFLHSPLTFGLVNSSGDYTGLNKNGTVTVADPDIEYGQFGDVQYLIAPAGEEYTVLMYGLADGNFSLDIQEQDGDDILRTTTIASVPVNSNTRATIDVSAEGNLGELQVEQGEGSSFSITPRPGETVVYRPVEDAEPIPAPPTLPASSSSSPSAPQKTPTKTVSISSEESNRDNEHKRNPTPDTTARMERIATTTGPRAPETMAAVTVTPVPSETPAPRTQTASAYDAFGSAVRALALRILGTLLILLGALVLWGSLRAKKKK